MAGIWWVRTGYVAVALTLALPWLWFGTLFAPDEYVHLYNACTLDALLRGEGGARAAWFAVNPFPEPNWLGHAVLLLLGQVLPWAVAERALVLLAVAVVGYAWLGRRPALGGGSVVARAAADARDGTPGTSATLRAGWAATLGVLALAVVFSATWQRGFVNYVLGLVLALAALRATAQRGRGARWSTGAWALLLYFAHPIALLYFVGLVVLRELGERWGDASSAAAALGATALAALRWFGLPLGLLAVYAVRQAGVSSPAQWIAARLWGLVYFHQELVLFAPAEAAFAKATFALAVLAGALVWVRAGRWPVETLVVALVGLVTPALAIALAPDTLVGGGIIHQRLLPLVVLWWLYVAAALGPPVWLLRLGGSARLGSLPVATTLVAALALLTSLAVVGLTARRLPALYRVEAVLDEVRELGAELPDGAVVLPLTASATGVGEGRPLAVKPVFPHFAHVLGCGRDVVLLDNYEATVGYFPLHWRPGRDPALSLDRALDAAPVTLPEGAMDELLGEVDYILALGGLEAALDARSLARLGPYLGVRRWSTGGAVELIEVRSGFE